MPRHPSGCGSASWPPRLTQRTAITVPTQRCFLSTCICWTNKSIREQAWVNPDPPPQRAMLGSPRAHCGSGRVAIDPLPGRGSPGPAALDFPLAWSSVRKCTSQRSHHENPPALAALPVPAARHPDTLFLVDEAFIGTTGFRVGYAILPQPLADDLNRSNDAYTNGCPQCCRILISRHAWTTKFRG